MAQPARPSAQRGAPRRCAGHGAFAVDRLVGALLGVETPAVDMGAGEAGFWVAMAGLGTRRSQGESARGGRQETTRWSGAGGTGPGWSRGS